MSKEQRGTPLSARLLQLWPLHQADYAIENLFGSAQQHLHHLTGFRQRSQSLAFAALSASDSSRKPTIEERRANAAAVPEESESGSPNAAVRAAARDDQGAARPQDRNPRLQDAPEPRLDDEAVEASTLAEPNLVNTEEISSSNAQQQAPSWRKRAKRKPAEEGWLFGKKLPDWLPKQMPHLQPFWVVLAPPGQPDKKRLMTVQDFFKYTEEEGRQFWNELDRDGDDRVSVDDVKAVLRRRKLPESYASDFIKAARGNRWWSNSLSWDEFKAMVDEREPKMLRAFTSMEVNPAGGLEQKSIKGTLAKVGVAATDEHARAMIKALGAEEDGFVSYGKFRNFLVLLPEAKLTGIDPSAVWFEAATMVPFGPPPSERTQEKRTGKMLLTAALAGGIASCVSTVALFPLDTLKTRLQSTAGASIASMAKAAPNIGARGLYRGIIPAATGNFVSHGMRTFSYEASFSTLTALTGGAAELQIQGLASGIGTFLGTCIRIPCEVVKQRLQTGRHANMLEAVAAATRVDGPRGLFRGTAATLSREVPFYVLGIVLFEQLKRAAKGNSFGGKGRDLAPWETIALGALAGALASVGTTPADVMKTRIMTAAADQAVDPRAIFLGIIRNEGVGALFKGALFRAAWTAPQGGMNFAGYELAKNALSQRGQQQDKEFQLNTAGRT